MDIESHVLQSTIFHALSSPLPSFLPPLPTCKHSQICTSCICQPSATMQLDSATDCRRKYIAQHLFRRFASQSRLSSGYNSKTSKLFCCDLRPANVLVDKDFKIITVIDWEFTYAAPPTSPTARHGGSFLRRQSTGPRDSPTGL